MQNTGRYYLYRHIRLDKNEPFYIGVGSKNKCDITYNTYGRAYSKHHRNNIWKSIASKTDFEVDILLEDNDLAFIFEKEKEFIKLYGQIIYKSGTLANISVGGDKTTLGLKMSSETKNKISKAKMGSKSFWKGKKMPVEARKKMATSKQKYVVSKYDLNGNILETYESIMEAERKTGCFRHGIIMCCKLKRKISKGFLWRYGNKEKIEKYEKAKIES